MSIQQMWFFRGSGGGAIVGAGLWTWGWNYYGQLGNNSTTDKSSPVQISGSWTAIAGGDYHTAGIKI